MGERNLEWIDLESIRPASKNPKDHDLGEIAKSIRAHGFVELPVQDDRTGRLVAGHGRLEALASMRKQGQPPPEGIRVADGGAWLVPVLRGWASASDAAASAYLVASNRTVELGGWDDEKLEELLVSIAREGGAEALSGTGYDGDDVDRLLRDVTPEPEPPPAEPEAEPWVKPGDVFELGAHRLMCGDSTVPEHLARLLEGVQVAEIVTDPPYAIYGSSTGIGADIADDKMVRPFFESILRTCYVTLPEFGHAYLFTDWRSWPAMWEAAKRTLLSPKNAIVWDKGGAGLGSNWANGYELVGYFAKLPPATAMKSTTRRGQRTVFKPNVQRFNRVTGDDREHNAAKPVELLVELVDAGSDRGDVVLDLFDGSGSTRIACEKSGRRGFGMEIEPRFAQVAIARWERLTGEKAKKVG